MSLLSIVKNWNSILLDDLKINKGEMLIGNCLYRMINVPDEIIHKNSLRTEILIGNCLYRIINIPDETKHRNNPRTEMLISNCLYRIINVPDDTTHKNSPRTDVLRFIKQIQSDVFLNEIINGTYNSSFFVTQFKEALFHYSSLFAMMEAIVYAMKKLFSTLSA